jgi:pimeloyl-ACP methyl ester carboxylesterase
MITHPHVVREPVDGERLVELRREEISVTARDGVRLSLLCKAPVDPAESRGHVVLIHGLRGTRHNWNLSRRSFQAYLVEQGFTTLCPELRGSGRSRDEGAPLPRSVRELVDLDLAAVVPEAAARAGGPLVLIGHSLGGLLACLAAARWPDAVRAVVALGSPLRPGIDQPLMRLGSRVWVGLARYSGLRDATEGERASAALAAGRRLMDRLSLPGRVRDVFPGSLEPDLEAEHARLVSREPPPPGLVRDLARLVLGRSPEGLDLTSELSRVRAPLLCVAGDRDELAPPSSVSPLLDAVGSGSTRWMVAGEDGAHVGHFDLVLGHQAPRLVWRPVRDWLVQV